MFDLIRGQVTRAWVVGLVRGACEAAVMALIMVAAGYLTALDFGTNTILGGADRRYSRGGSPPVRGGRDIMPPS